MEVRIAYASNGNNKTSPKIFGAIDFISLMLVLFCEIIATFYCRTAKVHEKLNTLPYLDGNTQNREFVRWEPYVYWKLREFESDAIHVDADGHRRTIQSGQETDTSTKIYMFGGSALWGMFVNDEDTIPSIAVKKLASKKYTDFYIKNYAQNGYVLTQGMLQLLFELRRGNVPDIVIFYDGVNNRTFLN